MTDITVPVPDDRTADFYVFFGHWLSGSLPQPSNNTLEGSQTNSDPSPHARTAWTGSSEEADDAAFLWSKLTGPAKAVFTLLMQTPGQRHTGNEIAETLNIPHGANGVAGVLAWPGRYCRKMDRHLPTRWEDGEDGAESVYWIEAAVADLFSELAA